MSNEKKKHQIQLQGHYNYQIILKPMNEATNRIFNHKTIQFTEEKVIAIELKDKHQYLFYLKLIISRRKSRKKEFTS